MGKSIQIPQELFLQLCKFHLADLKDLETSEAIYKGLSDKIDQMARRELYSTYKTAESAEEREKARQAYLDQIGLHKNFRW